MLSVPSTSTAANVISTCFYLLFASTSWMLDSGCSDHITPHIEDFAEYSPLTTPGHIMLGNKSTMLYLGVGLVKADCIINSCAHLSLSNVYSMPLKLDITSSLSASLILWGSLFPTSKEKLSYLTQILLTLKVSFSQEPTG